MTDRNRSQRLPRLQSGLTVLDRPTRRSTALHRLVLHELAGRDGNRSRDGDRNNSGDPNAFWLDAGNEASTYALYDLASGRHTGRSGRSTSETRAHRQLDGVRVARAFTAYQHHSLVRNVARGASSATELVVAPCFSSLYRDDVVPAREGRDLLESSISILAELANALDVPVLVTADGASDEVTDLLADYADARVECTRTKAGLRYASDDFETTVYLDDGYWQTTIPYWVELLGAVADEDPEVAATVAAELATAVEV